MSLSLDTVLQVVDLVQKAVEIYQRIKDAPETIDKIGQRMEDLKVLLVHLEQHLRNKSKNALASLNEAQVQRLLVIIERTREDSNKVYKLFEKWEKKIGPLGFRFRGNAFAQYVHQAYYALGSSASQLESLAAEIETHRGWIDIYVNAIGHQATQDAVLKMEKDLNERIKTMMKLLEAQAAAAATSQLAPAPGPAALSPAIKPKKSPSPSPSAPRRDFKLIFVDPHNLGRSICAEMLMDLYRASTKKVNGEWRIKNIQSGGFFCKDKNDCIDLIEKLDYSYKSYKLGFSKAQPLNKMATSAVFDNPSFSSLKTHKTDAWTRAVTRTSCGIKKDMFKKFDYIMVFTNREYDNLTKLKSAIIATDGKAAVGKAKIVHFGKYSTRDGSVKEILDARKDKEGNQSRDEWNKKVAQLKIAIKRFLQKEMEWTPPPNTADVP